MIAVALCAAFSGLTGFGPSLASAEGGASGAGVGLSALGSVGFAGVVRGSLRGV